MGIFNVDIGGIMGGVGTLAKDIRTAITGTEPINQEKAAELALKAQQLEAGLSEVSQNIIVAEMQQGDKFTKRARPMVVYSGLLFIFLVHVAFPIYAFFTGDPVPEISLPHEFWWAWTGVVAVWMTGRSMEKFGLENKATKLITGGK
jgi:hypothetical protein